MYTTKQISQIIGKSDRSVQRMAKRESWPYTVATVRGGETRVYPLDGLPHRIQVAIRRYDADQTPPPPQIATQPGQPVAHEQRRPSLPAPKIDEALLKADLARKYDAYVSSQKYGAKTEAKLRFIEAYNAGLLHSDLYRSVGPVSLPTLERWRSEMAASGDITRLADTRGLWRIRTTSLPEMHRQILLRCALHPNRPKISEAIRMAQTIIEAQGLSPVDFSHSAYRRWLNTWISQHYDVWVFSREGAKAWNDKCALYIERDINSIQVGDIIVADGHILNFEAINPFTGKPKRMMMIAWIDMRSAYPLGWDILPTENTIGIASAFRRACITLGKLPAVAYLDNGRAFGSRFFEGQDCSPVTGLFERAGTKVIHAWPYHGQSKLIERFFGTFAELERWCPTYTGTSITAKPPRLMRNERVHRSLHQKITGGACLTIDQAHMAIAEWFEAYARRPQSGHLNGAAPLDIFESGRGDGIDIRSLDLMMMAEEIRSPGRNGVYFLGRNYYAPELASLRHPVLIRYDLQKRDSVLVYDAATGDFLAEAVDMGKVHPAAAILGDDHDKKKLAEMIRIKKSQEKAASSYVRRLLESEVLPAHQARIEAITENMHSPGPKSPCLVQTTPGQPIAIDLSDDDRERIMAQFEAEKAHIEADRARQEEEDAAKQATSLLPIASDEPDYEVVPPSLELRRRLEAMRPADRYEELLDMEVMGQMIPAEWQAYMTYFEMTPEFKSQASYFESKRRLAASMRQRRHSTP